MAHSTGEVDAGGRPPRPARDTRREDAAGTVSRVVEPIVAALGVELVAVRCGGTRTAGTVRVIIDKPGGVTLDDCTRVSRALGHALDVEDPIEHRYTLEVSSPGLDRVLETPRDYGKAVGRLVRIKTRPTWDGPRVVVGRLTATDAEMVQVVGTTGELWTVPLGAIAQARLEVEW